MLLSTTCKKRAEHSFKAKKTALNSDLLFLEPL
jgi:hypothetical protein